MEIKRPTDSITIMTELVLPNDTNTLNNLMGGRLLHWMDICAALSAQKHSKAVCVTAAVNNVSFNHPIKLGNMVSIQSHCVRAFNTSIEVYIEVWSHDLIHDSKIKCNEAYYTFVALDPNGKPVPVAHVQPLSDEDKMRYDQALIRRQLKLLMSGKTNLSQNPELKRQFQKWIEGDSTPLESTF